MSSIEFERLVPGLQEQRTQERTNRALAFAGLTHTVCGVEILPLTPRHRLRLQLLQNAFTDVGRTPTLVDVFVFLWITSPEYGVTVEAARQQYFLRQDVAKMDPAASVAAIYTYLFTQLQDSGSGGGGDGKDFGRWVHWVAMDSEFYIDVHGGFTLEQYLDTPYLVLQQLYRAWQCNHPDVEYMGGRPIVRDPVFFNASDKMVLKFHRQHREAIKQHILKQRTRPNN